jgi:hypothetical protein
MKTSTNEHAQHIGYPRLDSPSLLPPAAKTLFVKRVLDSQKLFIKMVFIIFFSLCPFVYLCG